MRRRKGYERIDVFVIAERIRSDLGPGIAALTPSEEMHIYSYSTRAYSVI